MKSQTHLTSEGLEQIQKKTGRKYNYLKRFKLSSILVISSVKFKAGYYCTVKRNIISTS